MLIYEWRDVVNFGIIYNAQVVLCGMPCNLGQTECFPSGHLGLDSVGERYEYGSKD